MFASSILQSISAVPTKSKFLFFSSSDRSNLNLMESLFNIHYSHSHHHHDYTTSQSQSQVVSLKISPRFELSPNSSNTRRLVSLGGGGDAGGETLEKEARAAVAELLREEGLSEEESIDIGSNSPNYVKMLIEGVRELDEASLWDSWKVVDGGGGGVGTGSGGSQLSFKEKVLHIARVKKDRGILPFLESTGLNPYTSTHVARYLSSETLPNLIHK